MPARGVNLALMSDLPSLWERGNQCLHAQKPAEAVCFLTEIISVAPDDLYARMTLGLALGDAGHPGAAIQILGLLAERLVHQGYLLPAIAVIKHGLSRSPDEPRLVQLLHHLHIRGVRAKAGQLAVPPPLKVNRQPVQGATAASLLAMPLSDRLAQCARIGCELPPAGAAAMPQPMPLFCELDAQAFVETVKRLQYRRVPHGVKLLEEGAPGDSMMIIVSGHVSISKGQAVLCQIGPGAVLGEMALITHAPRTATATAATVVEYFELGREEVAQLSQYQPKVLQELVDYCRRRLLLNLLRTSPLFAQFDEESRSRLLEKFQTVSFSSGEEIIAQGNPGTGLFVMATGKAQVQIENEVGQTVVVGEINPGEVFGEISLLHNKPTTASVIAEGMVGALVLPVLEFRQVLHHYPQIHLYLQTLSADRLKASRDAVEDSGLVDPDDVVVL